MKMGLAPIRTIGACPIFMIQGVACDMKDYPKTGVASGEPGNVFISGWFEGTVDFGSGLLTCDGSRDIFVAKFEP